MTDRATKEEQLAFLKNEFKDVAALVLTSVQGLNAAEVDALRRKLHDAGVNYRVVKNTLAKKATEGTPLSVMANDFVQPTAIAWHKTDPVAPAKTIAEFKKTLPKFIIKSGFQGGNRLTEDGVKALATMPSLPELRAQILGLMNGVTAKMLAQFNAPAQHLVGVLQAKHDDDEKKAKAAA
ncbi:MAG: 50S ribosomal protein L10 [Deltaproteobacteria bacterium]|nr:50S ribosomal protein L10 [Deltaproteobacteria bacterium]